MTTTVVLQPTDGTDAYVRAGDPAANFDNTVLAVGQIAAEGCDRSIIKFDLSTIPQGANIISATLDLHILAGTGFGFADPEDIVNRNTADFVENTVTWNTKPAISGTKMGELAATVALDVAEFKLMLATNYGMTLRGREDAVGTDNGFASSEHATAAWHPKLTVEWLPSGAGVMWWF
jgi:hypothetical protein